MKRWGLSLMAILAATVSGWHVEFTPRQNNVGVQLETACFASDGRLTFSAIDYVAVDDETRSLEFRRHNEVPRGDTCTVVAFVFANDQKGDAFFGDPKGDYVIESTPYVEQK